jgi:hypothetical protein
MDHAITYAIELVNDAIINDGAQLHNRASNNYGKNLFAFNLLI